MIDHWGIVGLHCHQVKVSVVLKSNQTDKFHIARYGHIEQSLFLKSVIANGGDRIIGTLVVRRLGTVTSFAVPE